MRRTLLVLTALLGLSGCASGLDKVDGLSVEILETGIFTTLDIEAAKVTDMKLEETDTVPFVTGTSYGLTFKVNGEPLGAVTNVKLQWAVTPASVTNRRNLARLQEPRIRTIAVGEVGLMYVRIGPQSARRAYRRPYKDLFFITDMNGNVLARHEFTVVGAPGEESP